MNPFSRLLILVAALSMLLSACAPSMIAETAAAPLPEWKSADLRLLDPLDAPSGALDLIAGYMRLNDLDLQIRLDLLENEDPLGYDLHVALDLLPGGEPLSGVAGDQFAWDALLHAPAGADPGLEVRNNLTLPAARPRVVRDPFLDCIVLSVPAGLLQGKRQLSALAWISLPGENAALDTLGPFRLEGTPPAGAPLLLEFWDVLPARTPAQLLRRWDGAHTGPYGQRHGLVYLLRAAQANRVPITLLDLAQPASLRGLSLVGGLELVRQMQNAGLVSLPDNGAVLPEFSANAVALNRRTVAAYGLHPGQASFGFSGGESGLAFAVLRDSSHLQQIGRTRLVPTRHASGALPDETIDQNGLTPQAVSLLLQAALSADPADLVLLGGSLPGSPWGDLKAAAQAMQYIAGHPWMQPLSIADLRTFPAVETDWLHEIFACRHDPLCAGIPGPQPVLTPYGLAAANRIDSLELARQLDRSLAALPADPFAETAREMLATLTRPVADERIARLNASALTQAGYLIEASRWHRQPSVQAHCAVDLDWDGYPECVLSDETIFAVLDPEGGRLAFAAARRGNQAFQLVGPTAQTAAGLSDPSGWLSGFGSLADPAEIPGAFADPASEWSVYRAQPGDHSIAFTEDRRGIARIFALEGGRLTITLRGDTAPHRLAIPLSLPQQQNSPGITPRIETLSDRIRWPLSPQVYAELSLDGAAIRDQNSVLDTLPFLVKSENPDQAYPAGHYLPFPFLILTLSNERDFTAVLSIGPAR